MPFIKRLVRRSSEVVAGSRVDCYQTLLSHMRSPVNLSQMTVSEMSETTTTSSPHQKQHWLAEQMLRWSGLRVVYLRPTAFFDGMFLVQGARGIRDDDVIRLAIRRWQDCVDRRRRRGDCCGRRPGQSGIAHRQGVRTDRCPLHGDGGVRAGVQQALLGRTIQYVDVPAHIWEAKLHEAHLPAHLIAHLITMGQLHRDNRYDRMTDTFQQLAGRPPISAVEFARRHAATFTRAVAVTS